MIESSLALSKNEIEI